jgi:hypothetical protein
MTGCAGTREIIDLASFLPKKEQTAKHHASVAASLEHYFTPQANEVLQEIPAIAGPGFSGYAAGVNFWSNLASFISFNGVGRKVILPPDTLAQWGVASLIHEYIHHLDDLDRDGDFDFIDHQEFRDAYFMLAQDRRYAGIALWAERESNAMMAATWFGIGDLSEQIAYVGQRLATRGGPDYMIYVFRKMLRLNYKRVSEYTDIHGRIKEIRLPLE